MSVVRVTASGRARATRATRAARATALLCVFVLAKIAILAGHSVPLSIWAPVAYFWQDVLVALLYALIDRAINRSWFGWSLYAAIVALVTINVPLARVLSSPLTWPMMRAARGALSDSILHHATADNLALATLVAASGALLPRLLARILPTMLQRIERGSWRAMAVVVALGLLLVPLGRAARARVETIGLERNAVAALVQTALPRLSARSSEARDDWRRSLFAAASPSADDLGHLRAAARDRSVVLVLLESTAARHLRPYGASVDPMPNLTKLAQGGILFERAYAVYPESIKTLLSVLCARYPALDTATESYARITTPSIAAVLKASRYRTALFHSGRFMYLGMEEVVEGRGYDVLEDAGAIGGEVESSFGVDEPSTVRRMLAWIDGLERGERFFITYLPIAGHHPYETAEPGPFPVREGSEDADRHLNSLYDADRALAMLVAGLRERGLDEKTLLVIAGDHGEAFGEHEGNYGHSLFLYEENVRIPYLIFAPGMIEEGKRVARTVSLVDTAPTILDLLGIDAPAGYQGSSMLESGERMALFYTDYSLGLLGLRDGCWKMIDELDTGRTKLFNLCEDEEERRDLSASHPERVRAYRAHLRDWSAAQKALIEE